MAENIWYATTETEWITFNNTGSQTVTGDTEPSFSIQIEPATSYMDEAVGYVTLHANGKETVKTITRCLPELLCRDSKIICDITYEEGDNELLPCKSNPIEDGRVTISNVKIETTDYYSMDNSWEEITDCDDKTVGCEKFECLSRIPESNVEGKTSSADVTSYSVLYRIEGETNYYTEVPSNSGSDRKILITLQANGMSRDIPEFYFTQKGTAGAQLDNVIICETGETSTRVEYENFYIEATNIPDNQYTWIGNMMSISAYSNAQITQDSPSGEFASFSKTVTSRKYIGAITGETCCEPKFNVIMDDGQVTDCNDTDCPKTYQFRVIGANISAQFNGETLIFEPNASHSEYKSVSVTAKLIDNLNNIQKDSFKTVTFILPPNTNGGGYSDIYLNAIISKDVLEYNETTVSFKWFFTRGSSYTGGWKDGYSDFNAITSIDGESDEAFRNAMTNDVYVKVSNITYYPDITYKEEYGVFHIDNFTIGVNGTNANRTIKLFINDCFLASNNSTTVQATQKKITLYLHSYVTYNNIRYYGTNWPSLPAVGGKATITYFLSQTETINYSLYDENYILSELAYTGTAAGSLACTCATNKTCGCEEVEKCTCSSNVTCSNATGTYIKKKEVTLPSTLYEDDKQTFEFTVSCGNYVSGDKKVKILQEKFVPLYLYGYADNYSIPSTGGTITLKWFMTDKNPEDGIITDSDAVGVNPATFSGVNENTFTIVSNTTSTFKWNQENAYITLEGTTSYTNNIMSQTIKFTKNDDYGYNREITFKVGNKDAINNMFSLPVVVQRQEMLYTYAYVINSNGEKITEVNSEEQEVTLKWFVTTIDTILGTPITDEDAVWNNVIENSWLSEYYDVFFNRDVATRKYWDDLSNSDGIIKVGSETTRRIHTQKFKVLNNTTSDKTFTFGVTNSVAYAYSPNNYYEVTITQKASLIEVFIQISEDYNTEKKVAVTLPGDAASTFVLTYWATLNGQIVEASYEETECYETAFTISNVDSPQTTTDGKKQVKIHVLENNVNIVKQRCYKAVYNGISSDSVIAKQNGRDMTILPDFDYMTFKYNWTYSDGKDLDTATMITGVNSNDPIYDYLCTKYVGFGGVTPGISRWQEEYRTPLTGESNGQIVKFAEHGGDNLQSGLECALIYWKNICNHDYITNRTTVLYCDLYAVWYEEKRCNSECELEFKMYKKTENVTIEQEFKKVDINGSDTGTDRYGFAPNDVRIVQTGETQTKSNLKVYANGKGLHNSGSVSAVKVNYTHIARFTYDVLSKETSFEKITNGEKGFYLDIDGTCSMDGIQYQLSTFGPDVKYIYNSNECLKAVFSKNFQSNDTGVKTLFDYLRINSFYEKGVQQTVDTLSASIVGSSDWFSISFDSTTGKLDINILSANDSTTEDRSGKISVAFSGSYKIYYNITQLKQTT